MEHVSIASDHACGDAAESEIGGVTRHDYPARRGVDHVGPHGGGDGRLHHVTFATDQREDILRAADIPTGKSVVDLVRIIDRSSSVVDGYDGICW